MDKLVQVNHLKKYYPTHRGIVHAVDDVNFGITAGKTMNCRRIRMWEVNAWKNDGTS